MIIIDTVKGSKEKKKPAIINRIYCEDNKIPINNHKSRESTKDRWWLCILVSSITNPEMRLGKPKCNNQFELYKPRRLKNV
jgi:hypothetical protein